MQTTLIKKENLLKEAAPKFIDGSQSHLKIIYKQKKFTASLTTSDDAYHFLMRIWDKSTLNIQESFYAIFLNRDSEVIGHRLLHLGTLDTCCIDIKMLMSFALTCYSCKLIIAHNHPSGHTEPSELDVKTTKRVIDSANMLGIEMVDHLIISQYGYYSFRGHDLA